jgi:nitronate monooxygenase
VEFPRLVHPIVQAPMAAGPSTPELAAAVSNAGALGFVAGGYMSVDSLRADLERTRALTRAPFGVNLFLLSEPAVDTAAIERYARRLGVDPSAAHFDDDAFDAKLELVVGVPPVVVSTTFGCPSRVVVERIHASGAAVWATVTEVDEAEESAAAGVDALVVQGVEAGGHRGSFADENGRGEIGLLALLRLVARAVDLPLVATGGIADGRGVAAVLAAGARAAQIGTAFMRTPEAETPEAHRSALVRPAPTRLTRAFTGRRARGIVTDFMRDHDAEAPSAYPHVAFLTAAARAAGATDAASLWAGQAHALAEEAPAGDLVRRWSAEARTALEEAQTRLPATD